MRLGDVHHCKQGVQKTETLEDQATFDAAQIADRGEVGDLVVFEECIAVHPELLELTLGQGGHALSEHDTELILRRLVPRVGPVAIDIRQCGSALRWTELAPPKCSCQRWRDVER